MNQDFMIKATPGIARRLVALSKICRINLDDEIVELANTGLIAHFPSYLGRTQREVIQFLADADYRGMMLYDHVVEGKATALAAAIVSGMTPITILADTLHDREEWHAVATSLALSPVCIRARDNDLENPIDPQHNVRIITQECAYDKDVMKDARAGILLIDGYCAQTDVAEGLCIEFQHVIIANSRAAFSQLVSVGVGLYRRNRQSGQWYQNTSMIDVANHLFIDPSISGALYESKFVLDDLMSRGFVMPHPRKMATILGVSTHLLREARLVGEDDQ